MVSERALCRAVSSGSSNETVSVDAGIGISLIVLPRLVPEPAPSTRLTMITLRTVAPWCRSSTRSTTATSTLDGPPASRRSRSETLRRRHRQRRARPGAVSPRCRPAACGRATARRRSSRSASGVSDGIGTTVGPTPMTLVPAPPPLPLAPPPAVDLVKYRPARSRSSIRRTRARSSRRASPTRTSHRGPRRRQRLRLRRSRRSRPCRVRHRPRCSRCRSRLRSRDRLHHGHQHSRRRLRRRRRARVHRRLRRRSCARRRGTTAASIRRAVTPQAFGDVGVSVSSTCGAPICSTNCCVVLGDWRRHRRRAAIRSRWCRSSAVRCTIRRGVLPLMRSETLQLVAATADAAERRVGPDRAADRVAVAGRHARGHALALIEAQADLQCDVGRHGLLQQRKQKESDHVATLRPFRSSRCRSRGG